MQDDSGYFRPGSTEEVIAGNLRYVRGRAVVVILSTKVTALISCVCAAGMVTWCLSINGAAACPH